MKTKNYIKLKYHSFFKVKYAYMDTQPYLADQIFINHKIKVKFGTEFENKDAKYVLILCKVKKKDEKEFKKALDELKTKVLLFEHKDYEEHCEKIFGILKEEGCASFT